MTGTVLLRPLISEKGLARQDAGEYAFVVGNHATKPMIKSAVAGAYRVKVQSVRTKFQAGKTKRTGKRRLPKRSADTKIAMVKLAAGHKIDLLPEKK